MHCSTTPFTPGYYSHQHSTHQQIQLNPHSNALHVHINYSALHPAQTAQPTNPNPPTLPPIALWLPWQPEVAVLMSETPPRTLVQALGQVMCTAAGHRLTPKNKMAAIPIPIPIPTPVVLFAAWESVSLSLSFKQKRKCTCALLDTFFFFPSF